MTAAFGASDADGAWLWKDSYEAAEAALVLFLQHYGRAMRREAGAGPGGPAAMLRMLETLAALEPSHTRRSEQQLKYQQFSTPLPLAYAALQAAAIRPGDVVLEPSAGTGMLAVMAQLALGNGAAGALHLNEIAATRAGLLAGLFPGSAVTRHNAESIRDRLPEMQPTVVLMNPPFSASRGIDRIRHHVDLHHIRSAFSMLPPGGRLVAISSEHCVPGDAAWEDAFASLDPPAHAVFTAPIDGRAYARRGTAFDTRLTVLDRGAEKPGRVYAGHPVRDAGHLLHAIIGTVPDRRPIEPVPGADLFGQTPAPRSTRARRTKTATQPQHVQPQEWGPVAALAYEAVPAGVGAAGAAQPSGPYARWRASGIHVPGAVEHPTPLVQSGAMAAVPHPMPSYRPMLPEKVLAEGLLSDAQLESVVLAGQAHERHLAAEYRIGAGWETVRRVDAEGHDDNDEAAPASDDGSQIRRCRRAAVRSGPLPARLDAGRRHRLRQGQAGRRHRPRPVAPGPQAGALALPVRQAAGGRAPRLVRRRRPRGGRHSPRQGAPGGRHPPCRRASCSPPMPRCAPPRGRGSPHGSTRSWVGSRTARTRTSATPIRA